MPPSRTADTAAVLAHAAVAHALAPHLAALVGRVRGPAADGTVVGEWTPLVEVAGPARAGLLCEPGRTHLAITVPPVCAGARGFGDALFDAMTEHRVDGWLCLLPQQPGTYLVTVDGPRAHPSWQTAFRRWEAGEPPTLPAGPFGDLFPPVAAV